MKTIKLFDEYIEAKQKLVKAMDEFKVLDKQFKEKFEDEREVIINCKTGTITKTTSVGNKIADKAKIVKKLGGEAHYDKFYTKLSADRVAVKFAFN